LSRKKVSHRRSNFPSRSGTAHCSTQQRLGEFDADQVVTLTMSYPNNFGAQISGALRNRSGRGQRRARDFERNLCCWPKRTMHSDQGPAGRYVDGRGKLKKIFAAVVLAANENGNGKRQSNPLAAFGSRLVALQILSPVQLESDTSGTSWAKLMMRNGKEDNQRKGEAIEMAKVLCFVRQLWITCPLLC